MSKMNIYADNAATTRMSDTAFQAMLPYFEQHYGNPSSLHQPGQEAARALTRAREQIAASLGCLPGEIYFTSGGSEANNQALLSAARSGAAQGKRHILSTAVEHPSVLRPLEQLASQGWEVELLPVDEYGLITASELASSLRDDTCLVSIMYANNEIGSVFPLAEIAAVCQEKGVLLHSDAVQVPGQLELDLSQLPLDMLSLSAHKFHGPKGIGLLFARRGTQLSSLIAGGAQERGYRAGTENIPAIVGMAAALQEACQRRSETAARLSGLRDRLIDSLLRIPGSVLNGDPAKRLAGNINICFEGVAAESLLLLLDREGIYASSGSACSSGALDTSHVLLAIGRSPELAHGSLRLTLGVYNTEAEVEHMLTVIPAIVAHLRGLSA